MQIRKKDFGDASKWLWTDLPDATSMVSSMHPKTDTKTINEWIKSGYAILPDSAPIALAQAFRAELFNRLGDPDHDIKMTYWDDAGHHHEQASIACLDKLEAKVLDLHVRIDAAQQLIFAPKILDFLIDVFQDDVVAFQSLYFENGSQQGAHQDTAFVYTEPASHFAASWIALEDVVPGAGELFYYPGSQGLDDLIFADGTKALRGGDPDADHYSSLLEKVAADNGFPRMPLHIPAGTALIWAADLIHGGEPVRIPHSRHSLVTHYCPKRAVVPYARHLGLQPFRVTDRGWVVAAY
jgi:hypothetical protein